MFLTPKSLHKRSISSPYYDLEKNPRGDGMAENGKEKDDGEGVVAGGVIGKDDGDDDDENQKREFEEEKRNTKRVDYVLIILVILIVGSVLNFVIITNTSDRGKEIVSRIGALIPFMGEREGDDNVGGAVGGSGAIVIDGSDMVDTNGIDTDSAGSANSADDSMKLSNPIDIDTDIKIGITGGKSSMKVEATDHGLKSLLNVDNIDPNDLNEWEKFANELTVNNGNSDNSVDAIELEIAKSKDEENKQDLNSYSNPQFDLAEILAINPIVLLINDEFVAEKDHVKQILQNLNINPEVKLVNLMKHPHYEDILDYLKNYRLHVAPTLANVGTKANEPEFEQQFVHQYNMGDIPRLFIGGLPVADYQDIIDKFNNNQLDHFLNEFGKGQIKLQI